MVAETDIRRCLMRRFPYIVYFRHVATDYANRTAAQRKQDGPRYQVTHVLGEGPHSDNHGGAILPDMLRWIWMDYPK